MKIAEIPFKATEVHVWNRQTPWRSFLLFRIYTLDVQFKVFQHDALTWTKLHSVIAEGMDFDL